MVEHCQFVVWLLSGIYSENSFTNDMRVAKKICIKKKKKRDINKYKGSYKNGKNNE